MNVDKIRTLISHRLAIDINDNYGRDKIRRKLIETLTENITETIEFFDAECSAQHMISFSNCALSFCKSLAYFLF